MSAMHREPVGCAVCGSPVGYTTGGRPRRYCRNACKTKAWRIRRALVEGLAGISRPAKSLDYEDEHRVA